MCAGKPLGSQKPIVKTDEEDDSGMPLENHSASYSDASSPKMSPDTAKSTGVVTEDVSGNCEGNDLMMSSLQCDDKKLKDVAQNDQELSDCNGQKDVGFSAEPRDNKEGTNGSEASTLLCRSLSLPKQISWDAEVSKSGITTSLAAPSSKLRLAISLGKSPSTGSSIVISKSSSSIKSDPPDTGNVLTVGHQAAADFREHAPSTVKTEEGKHDVIRKTEEHSLCSHRIFPTSIPKGNASDLKDCTMSSSSKSFSAQNVSANIGSADSTNTQSQRPFPVHNRTMASGLSAKVGKVNNSAPHSSLKGSHVAAGHQPVVSNAPAGLSDEEVCTLLCPLLRQYLLQTCLYDLVFFQNFFSQLALLLHQELNSSPRVPRVPRVRQASFPQLASQTASALHTKRTSSSGAKDQNSVG